jgi:succinoglycan biosynthesis protein ExoO
VISPLLAGSGLKIKLIEALGHGKAVVATSATVEGVEEVVKPAVAVADDADAFAGAIAELLTDHALRDRKCQEALTIAKRSFSAEACYADLLDFIEQRHDRTQH